MTSEERALLIEELKLSNDDYKYRDQLIVTEFGLAMTAFAVGLNAAKDLSGWLCVLLFFGISLFLLIVANHIGRVNQDRLAAGDRVKKLKDELGLVQIHQGYAGKRTGVKIPAPKSMVWFLWLAAISSVVTMLVMIFRQLGCLTF